jgi:hypothetical protein
VRVEDSLAYTLAALTYPKALIRLLQGGGKAFKIKKTTYQREPPSLQRILRIHKYIYRFSYASLRRLGQEEPMIRELYAHYQARREITQERYTPAQSEAADKIRELFS